jgi:N utilization substance protein B
MMRESKKITPSPLPPMPEPPKGDQPEPGQPRGSEHQELIKQRRLARRLALQALFEIDCVAHSPGAAVDGRLADEETRASGEFGIGAPFLRWLVSGVVKHRDALDGLVQKYAPEWPVDQLAIVDRNILRLALFELGAQAADTPQKVVINEAVELGKHFGSDSTPRFVNGVLGSALEETTKKPFSGERAGFICQP